MFLGVPEIEYRQDFSQLLWSLSDSEAVFLMTTFANMAMKRSSVNDKDLCSAIILELFHVTYLDSATRSYPLCTKTGRDLLGSICVTHPDMITFVLVLVSDHMLSIGKVSLHLFRGLPIHSWVPPPSGLEILRDWLLNPNLESSEHELSRHILSNINWGTKDRADVSHNLFLSPEHHLQAAFIVTEAITAHIGEESLSFLSQITTFGQLTPQRLFLNWCWSVLLSLHLHDLSTDPSATESRLQGIEVDFILKHAAKHPTAAYVALEISPSGYVFGQFKEIGLGYLVSLVDTYCYTAALRVICDVIPRFIVRNGPELSAEPRFTYVIKSLLDADETYPTLVMHGVLRRLSLMTSREEDNITEMLISVIQDQLHFIPRSDEVWPSWQQIVEFWIESVCRVDGWHLLASGRLIFDNLLQAAFISTNGRVVVFRTLSVHHLKLLSSMEPVEKQTHFLNTVMSWITTPRIPPPPSFLDGHPLCQSGFDAFFREGKLPLSANDEVPWMVFEVLFMETKQETQLRLEVGKLLIRKPTLPIEDLVKVHDLKMPVDHFSIYRWAYFACSLDMDHPLLPLFWQMFFTLFFAEVYDEVYDGKGDANVKGFRFGDRFLGQGQALMKNKISKKLTQLRQHHRLLARKKSSVILQGGIEGSPLNERHMPGLALAASLESGVNDETVSDYHKSLSELYRAMNLWLFDKSSVSLRVGSLPSEYCLPRIKSVVQCDPLEAEVLWNDLVDTDEVSSRFQAYVKRWNERFSKWDNNALREESVIDIFRELCLDGECVSVPVFRRRAPSAKELNIADCTCNEDLIRIVQEEIDKQVLAAKQYVDNLAFHASLDADYIESLPEMYINENKETSIDVPCNQRKTGKVCRGPARFVFQYKQKRIVEHVVDKISEDRRRLADFLAKPIMKPELCLSVLRLQRTVRFMAVKASNADDSPLQGYAKALFYYLINVIDENMRQYPPTESFLTRTVDSLGKNFICKDPEEAPKLLDVIVSDPRRGAVLASVFYPSSSCKELPRLFVKVCNSIATIGNELVVKLLSRFDIPLWISQSPSVEDQQKLMNGLVWSVKQFGQESPPHLEEFIAAVRKMYAELLIFHAQPVLERCLEDCLSAIVERSLPVIFFSDLCATVKQMSEEQIHIPLALEKILTERLMYVRHTTGGLYASFLPYLEDMLKLYESIIYSLSFTSDDNIKMDERWVQAYHLFEPWLCAVKSQSPQQSDPWRNNEPEKRAACTFGMAYVECLQLFIDQGFSERDAVMRVWDWYFTSLCHSSPHVLPVYHDFLTSLPWQCVMCDNDTLVQMIQMDKIGGGECLLFISHILERVNWKQTERDASGHVYNVTATQYYQNLLHVLVLCIANPAVVSNDHFIEFLKTRAHNFQWVCLDNVSYCDVLRLNACKGKAVFLFNENASLCQYSKMLRAAVGFPRNELADNTDLVNRAAQKLHHYLVYVTTVIAQSVDLDTNSYTFATKFLLDYVLDEICLPLQSNEHFRDVLTQSLRDILNMLNNCAAGDVAKTKIVNSAH